MAESESEIPTGRADYMFRKLGDTSLSEQHNVPDGRSDSDVCCCSMFRVDAVSQNVDLFVGLTWTE